MSVTSLVPGTNAQIQPVPSDVTDLYHPKPLCGGGLSSFQALSGRDSLGTGS